MNLFALPLMPLMVALGFWQLDRAEEKTQILAAQEALLAASPQRLGEAAFENYQPVTLVGEYDTERHFLLDNVVYNGRVGYDVITPFYDSSGVVVLVNRGWLPAGDDRSILPDIISPVGRLVLAGNVGRNLGKPFLLGEQDWVVKWPQRIQAVEINKMAGALDLSLADYFVRLNMASPGAYQYHYKTVNVMPSKHLGYAVQWFAMTFALLTLYLLFGLGKFNAKKAE